MKTSAVLSAVLLLFSQTAIQNKDETPIAVLVMNSVTREANKTYSTYVAPKGILLGGLSRLQNSSEHFKFTYIEDPNYGPFLVSVNDLAGNKEQHTYWQLLVKSAEGKTIAPEVGIGCYIPKENDQIILNFKMW